MTKIIAITIIVLAALATYYGEWDNRTTMISNLYFNIVSLSAALFWWTL